MKTLLSYCGRNWFLLILVIFSLWRCGQLDKRLDNLQAENDYLSMVMRTNSSQLQKLTVGK